MVGAGTAKTLRYEPYRLVSRRTVSASGSVAAVTASTPDPTRRNEHSRRSILSAAIAVTGELGYDRASVEAIARRAGVGKQTIYRWWPSKGAVLLEALVGRIAAVVELPFPDTGDIVEDMRANMMAITQLLATDDNVRTAYQGLIAAAQSDPALSDAHLEQLTNPPSVICHQRLSEAQDRGELRAGADIQAIIDTLWGALYYRLLLHTRPLELDQIDAALDIVVNGLR